MAVLMLRHSLMAIQLTQKLTHSLNWAALSRPEPRRVKRGVGRRVGGSECRSISGHIPSSGTPAELHFRIKCRAQMQFYVELCGNWRVESRENRTTPFGRWRCEPQFSVSRTYQKSSELLITKHQPHITHTQTPYTHSAMGILYLYFTILYLKVIALCKLYPLKS